MKFTKQSQGTYLGAPTYLESDAGHRVESSLMGPFRTPRLQVSKGGEWLRVPCHGDMYDHGQWDGQAAAAVAAFDAGERGEREAIPAPAPSLHPLDVGFDPALVYDLSTTDAEGRHPPKSRIGPSLFTGVLP